MENDTTTMLFWTTMSTSDPISESFFTHNATIPAVTTAPVVLPPFLDQALVIVLLFMFVFGVTGNFTTIWIFNKTKSLRTPPNMLIVNLATSDLLIIITNYPLMFASTLYNRWLFGHWGCQIYAFFGSLSGIMSIATMTAIALDRYYVICWSLEAVKTVTRRRSMIIILIVWAYAIFWSVPPFFGFGSYVLEGYGLGCTFDFMTHDINHYVHVSLLFASSFVCPVAIIVICFARIAMTVRKHRHELNKIRARITEDKDKKHKASIRRADKAKTEFAIAKVGAMVTVMFVVSWMPYSVVAVIGQYFDPELLTPLGSVIPVIFAKCSAIWNPVIYVFSHEKFKRALKEQIVACFGMETPRGRGMLSGDSTITSRRGLQRQQSSTISEASISSTVDQDALQMKDRKATGDPPATVSFPSETGGSGDAGTYRKNPSGADVDVSVDVATTGGHMGTGRHDKDSMTRM